MITAQTLTLIRCAVLAMLCVLGLRSPGWTQNPPAAAKADKPSENASVWGNDPALRVRLTVNFMRPKAQDILDYLRKETKADFSLADNIDRKRPALGSLSCHNVPAWFILDQLAKSPIIQGKWERHGHGYRLTSPLPPPPVLAKAIPSAPPSPASPAKLGLRYLLFALPLLAIFGILLLLRRRRRSQQQQPAAARETIVN